MDTKELSAWLSVPCKIEAQVRAFAVDSRKVLPGDVFLALSGEKTDGHHFVEEAFAKGALLAIVSRPISHLQNRHQDRCLVVPCVLQALHTLAKRAWEHRPVSCVAITGSMGKTTTKEFLVQMLSQKFHVESTPGNANSQIGLPLSLLNRTKGDLFIAEMGMSMPGEIAKLTTMLPPDIVVLTHIAYAHTAAFPEGLEEVACAKAEILVPHTKTVILHASTATFKAFTEHRDKKWIPYGALHQAHMKGSGLSSVLCTDQGVVYPCPLLFSAEHLAENIVAAGLVAREFGMSWEEIVYVAKKLMPYPGRFASIEHHGVLYINDAYNANPQSMKIALKALPKHRRRIGVLGEMRELGLLSEILHREVGEVANETLDLLIAVGKQAKSIYDAFCNKPAFYVNHAQEARQILQEYVRSGDVVLVKGANALQLWTAIPKEEE